MNYNSYDLLFKDHCWQVILRSYDKNNNVTCETLVTSFTSKAQKQQALNIANSLVDSTDKPMLEPKKHILFVDYISKYIESIKASLSPQVYYNYTHFCLIKIKAYFDDLHLDLTEVTTNHIQSFYNYLLDLKYKPSSIMQISKIIRPALKTACETNLIDINPYINVKPISKTQKSVNFYNKLELNKLLSALSGHKLELAFKIAIYYGLRRSELLGLRWSSINFCHNYITINHKVIYINKQFILSDKLKTFKSYRTLPLIKDIKNELLLYKRQKMLNMDKIGISYNHKFDDYVFTDDFGNLILPNRLDYTLSSIIKKHHLPHIRFHDLRHSCASLLLSQGVQLKEIQEWLGHSSYSTTADIYSHLDLVGKSSAAKSISNALSKTKLLKNEKSLFNKLSSCYDEVKKLGYNSLDSFFTAMCNSNINS